MTELPYCTLATLDIIGTMGPMFICHPILDHGMGDIRIKRCHVCCYVVQHDMD
jgi:hypothetical protein